MKEERISEIRALEVLDSRAFPTVSAEVRLESGILGHAFVPSGASVGRSEAVELRDGDRSRWSGKGVLKAVQNVNEIIAPALKRKVADVRDIDQAMIELDGTLNKSKLGANAILAVSLANARAVADSKEIPLYELISELNRIEIPALPLPMVNIISGGLHAGGNLDMQDFLAIPVGAKSFRQAMDFVGKIYHATRSLLKERGFSTLLADEGGFGPNFQRHEDALKLLSEVIEKTSLSGEVEIGIDVASSHFYIDNEGKYVLKSEGLTFDSRGMVDFLSEWCDRFPIVSIEDGCAEGDWEGWKLLTKRLGSKVQLIGDDLFTTNTSLIKKGIESHVGNSVLIKLNQIGTLSETLDAIAICKENHYAPVVSARSGETEDPFIADLALGTTAGQLKVGSIARSERTAKYNRLLELETREGLPFVGRDVLAASNFHPP
jgi:enolase